jgi:hypothetical protein
MLVGWEERSPTSSDSSAPPLPGKPETSASSGSSTPSNKRASSSDRRQGCRPPYPVVGVVPGEEVEEQAEQAGGTGDLIGARSREDLRLFSGRPLGY